MQFEEFLSLLPVLENPPQLIPADGVTYVDTPNPNFVPPSFKVATAPAGRGMSVVLVSSPAAVGKTTAAAEVARRIGAPLWNLARFNVGTDTYLGRLTATYGPAVHKVLSDLGEGKFCLVMDALDEAELRAGRDNFDEFLRGVCEAHQRIRERPALVLFARGETAEWVALYLSELGVPFARFTLDFFDRPGAQEFISKRLDSLFDARGESRAHRRFEEAYLGARDALFARIFDLLGVQDSDPWSSEQARSFAGYAPVLEALARYLFVGDYQELVQRLRARERAGGLWQFLVEIVEDILDRERQKATASLRAKLGQRAEALGWSGWDELYAAREQCDRVLAKTLPSPDAEVYAPSIPPELRPAYEEGLREWLPNHAFVGPHRNYANVVFEEYLYAHHLIAGLPANAGRVRDRVLQADFLPSPLLGRFLLTMADRGDGATLAGEDFGVLYESLRAQMRFEGDVTLDLQGDGTVVAAKITGPDRHHDASLDVVPGEAGVHFLRTLSNATIGVGCRISLGLSGAEFNLGPGVDLDCGILRVPAASVRVHARPLGQGQVDVVIQAQAIEAIGGTTQLDVVGGGTVAVVCATATYPWVLYRATVDPSAGDERFAEPTRYLSRILVRFRGAQFGSAKAGQDLIDNIAVGDSLVALAVRDLLLRERVIEPVEHAYKLNSDRMQELGINWTDVRSRRVTPAIRTLFGGL